MKTTSYPAHTGRNGSLDDWPSQARKRRNWKLSYALEETEAVRNALEDTSAASL